MYTFPIPVSVFSLKLSEFILSEGLEVIIIFWVFLPSIAVSNLSIEDTRVSMWIVDIFYVVVMWRINVWLCSKT